VSRNVSLVKREIPPLEDAARPRVLSLLRKERKTVVKERNVVRSLDVVSISAHLERFVTRLLAVARSLV
jgi:hypothetical protein